MKRNGAFMPLGVPTIHWSPNISMNRVICVWFLLSLCLFLCFAQGDDANSETIPYSLGPEITTTEFGK